MKLINSETDKNSAAKHCLLLSKFTSAHDHQNLLFLVALNNHEISELTKFRARNGTNLGEGPLLGFTNYNCLCQGRILGNKSHIGSLTSLYRLESFLGA